MPETLVGIAQGCPLSPLFANVYLAGFDKTINDNGYKLVRYADDFVIMTKTRNEAKDAFRLARKDLKKIKLGLHDLKDDIPELLWEKDAKYSIVRTCQHLEFLGVRFASGKVYPAGTAYKSVMKNIRQVADDRTTGLTVKLYLIDAKMRGWCTSYSFTTIEPKQIKDLDGKLEEVLKRMLKMQGLKKIRNEPIQKILGLSSFTQLSDKVRSKTA